MLTYLLFFSLFICINIVQRILFCNKENIKIQNGFVFVASVGVKGSDGIGLEDKSGHLLIHRLPISQKERIA